MKPSPTSKFNALRTELFQINKLVNGGIGSVESLMEVKTKYLEWLFSVQELAEDQKIENIASALKRDYVVDHMVSGGVGVEFGDQRSMDLLRALKEETKNRIVILDNMAQYFNNRILEKRGGVFNLHGKALDINPATDSYHLLNILFSQENNEVVPYEDLITSFKLLPGNRKATRRTLANARDNLFRSTKGSEKILNLTPSGKKLIETRRSIGFLLNNNENLK